MKKRYIMGMFLTVLGLITAITIVPSLMATENHKRTKIPFAGMTMSYQAYCTAFQDAGSLPLLFSRVVTFYKEPSEPDYIWVRDTYIKPDDLSDDRVWKINIETRKIVGQEGYCSFALFPTNLHVGDEVIGHWGGAFTIIGSQRMSVMGKHVDAWIACISEEWGYYTFYYEKKTGIWLGGTFVWYDGDTLNTANHHLVSTNVPLFEED